MVKKIYLSDLCYSETLELFSLTEPNRIKHGFAGSELFQYFDVFSSSVRSNRTLFYCIWMILHDVFDAFEWFLWVRTELEKTSKYWKNSIRFDRTNLIEFDSVRYTRKVLEFHCNIRTKEKNDAIFKSKINEEP
jgi:hypothetical protein